MSQVIHNLASTTSTGSFFQFSTTKAACSSLADVCRCENMRTFVFHVCLCVAQNHLNLQSTSVLGEECDLYRAAILAIISPFMGFLTFKEAHFANSARQHQSSKCLNL